jgi:hypothetical protein
MDFEQHFQMADDYIDHVDQSIADLADGFIQSRYLGFTIVSAVTVYEIAAKDIIFDFTRKKHKVFGEFTEKRFDRFNVRIQINQLRDDFVHNFGDRYERRFVKKLNEMEDKLLASERLSMKGAYKNLITWRHAFVHAGEAPTTTNYDEVKKSYHLGKNVLRCLAQSLVR